MSDDSDSDTHRFAATNSVHAGQEPDSATGARAPPIYQTTSYVFDDTDHAAALFGLEEMGNIYSRIMNPTNAMLEERIATLEGGVGALATSSGMAAFDLATFILAEVGDNIVSSSALYGGTYTYLTHTVAKRGIETKFVDTLDYDAYAEAIDDDTAFVHLETIGNPALITPDIERIADIAHEHNVPLFVDNTFATPYLCRPLEHGADLVWNSTTKWIHGAGSTVGGILVDGGSFPGRRATTPRSPSRTRPITASTSARRSAIWPSRSSPGPRGLRDLGNQQSPFDAWTTLQKLESLPPLRMEKHCDNAMAVAEYLEEHSAVDWVNYPGLESHETHEGSQQVPRGRLLRRHDHVRPQGRVRRRRDGL